MPTDRRTLLAVWALAEARRLRAIEAQVAEAADARVEAGDATA